MKLQKGDILAFIGGGGKYKSKYAAKMGAKAIYNYTYQDEEGEEFINIKWIRDELSGDQEDGGYFESTFIKVFEKVEEVSTHKEDRILKENKKDMKFDFERGKRQLLTWMDNEFDCCYGQSLQYIKELSTIASIQNEVESFRRFEESWMKKTSTINRATTMREVFEALKDTALEEDDNFIIELFTTEQ